MAVWLVRGGSNGERENEALDNMRSTIGFGGLDDVTNTQRPEDVRAMLEQRWRYDNPGVVTRYSKEIWNFKDSIEVGDLIVMPRKGQPTIAIGEVVGEYEYRRKSDSELDHGRKVTWINQDVLRRSLDPHPDLKMGINTLKTVHQIKSEDAESKLRAIAEGQLTPPVSSASQRPVIATRRAIAEGQLTPPGPPPPPSPPPPEDPWSPANIAVLAEELLWEQEYLQEIIDDLKEKRQVIFYGPPGTGKTYVAREIARQCELNGGDFEIVQFHPSYSYEDFVEGFRPRLHNGQPGFDLVDGPLRRIAEQAKANPDATFILVIDELNRGNVAKVFGELYFLLEYRDEAVRLQYGGDDKGFSLPSNLWFICTMNTADRSIALMDAALRRRFYFAPFFPDEPPIKGLLRQWLEKHDQANTWVAGLVDKANENLNRDAGIGPSYFMGGGTLDETRVRRIWKRAVLPYVEEQCFGDDAKLREFDFDRLKGQLTPYESPDQASLQAQLNGETNPPQANDEASDPS